MTPIQSIILQLYSTYSQLGLFRPVLALRCWVQVYTAVTSSWTSYSNQILADQFYCLFCTWRARFCIGMLEEFSVHAVKFVNHRGAISTAEICCRQPLASRRAYSWSLEDWYCCVQNHLLHTLVLVSVMCALLFLSYKQNKKARPAGLFRRSWLPAKSVYTWSRNSPAWL